MQAYFPPVPSVTVKVSLEVEMVGKLDNNIYTPTRVINEINALMFMAVTVGGSVRRRPLYVYMFVLMARCPADPGTPA
jgi:hypothetical protein